MCPQSNFDQENESATLGNSEAINGWDLSPRVAFGGGETPWQAGPLTVGLEREKEMNLHVI